MERKKECTNELKERGEEREANMLVLKELMIEQARGAQRERKTIYSSHPNPRIIFTVCLTLTIDEELKGCF